MYLKFKCNLIRHTVSLFSCSWIQSIVVAASSGRRRDLGEFKCRIDAASLCANFLIAYANEF